MQRNSGTVGANVYRPVMKDIKSYPGVEVPCRNPLCFYNLEVCKGQNYPIPRILTLEKHILSDTPAVGDLRTTRWALYVPDWRWN